MRYLRRTDLFLVRMWTDTAWPEGPATRVYAKGLGVAPTTTDASGHGEWSGSVQRVVDGEARHFTGWQSLVDTLLAMLAETRDMPERQEVAGNEDYGGTTNE